jgi:hypothetical protein
VSGNDVYVAGKADGDAALWKNGVWQRLGDDFESAPPLPFLSVHPLFVSGDDVYLLGWHKLWKNGVTHLINHGFHAMPCSLFVSGDDVYVAMSGGNDGAVLWKNGVAQKLNGAQASSVFVSGGDVYVAGREYFVNRATLWKNGVPQRLSDNNSTASAVFVSGDDVYVAGQEDYRATLWKNGVAQRLSDKSQSWPHSIFVFGSDVYVAGWECEFRGDDSDVSNYGISHYATLWKNGVAQRLSNEESSAYSVFVK